MPTKDFTLEDMKGLFAEEREYTKGLFVAEREHTEGLFVSEREFTKGLLVKERVHTQGMIEDSLLNFWDINLQPAFDDLHVRLDKHEDEIKGMKRVQRKHSADIVALQALNGI